MTRRLVVHPLLLLAVAGIVAQPVAQDRPAVFRAGTAATSVHVAVRDGNRPVAGLTAEDFILTDNGVRQTIQAISVGTTPIDVTIVLDTSGSVSGPAIELFRRDVIALGGLLGPDDRLRVLGYASRVVELRPLTLASVVVPTVNVTPGGATAFFHAIVAALARRADPGRPHLVLVLGDGGDNVSLLDDRDVQELARRSDAVLHVIIRPDSGGLAGGSGWLPFYPPVLDRIRAAAALTGGRLDELRTRQPSLALLDRAIDEFKTAYVLWYTPTAVPQTGWHELAVRLRSGRYTVTARRGYFGGLARR
jgi:VWFA-related protein